MGGFLLVIVILFFTVVGIAYIFERRDGGLHNPCTKCEKCGSCIHDDLEEVKPKVCVDCGGRCARK